MGFGLLRPIHCSTTPGCVALSWLPKLAELLGPMHQMWTLPTTQASYKDDIRLL